MQVMQTLYPHSQEEINEAGWGKLCKSLARQTQKTKPHTLCLVILMAEQQWKHLYLPKKSVSPPYKELRALPGLCGPSGCLHLP